MSTVPETPVDQEMISLDETLQLSVQDDWQSAKRKGLYDQPADKIVVISDEEGEVIAITTAGKLLGEIVGRSWLGPLSNVRRRLPMLPVVSAATPLASLDYLVQELRDAEWLLVVDETRRPVGVLESRVVLDKYLPPPDTTQETVRTGEARLWGDPTEKPSIWYCSDEGRIYLQHDVTPDAEGNMRDPKGHRVERR